MQLPLETIVFDFDYTLVDSSRGTIDGVNFALEKMGLPIASEDAVRQTIGLSLPDILARLAGEAYTRHIDEFINLFLQQADRSMVASAEFYNRIPETLKTLQQLGLYLAIVSQKRREYIRPILARENLLPLFKAIVGGGDAPYKPNPEGLLQAITETRAAPENCIYVGDSVTDAETARRAGIAFIAVLSGVTPRAAFKDYHVYAVLEDVSELLHLEPVNSSR